MKRCECCDHPLQHAIRWAIARYDAPIPPPSARELVSHLRDALEQWEAEPENPDEVREHAHRS